MAGETITSRMMVQANWDLASTLLPAVLQAGPRAWADAERARLRKKLAKTATWRFDWDDMSAPIPHVPVRAPIAAPPIIRGPHETPVASLPGEADVVRDVRSKAPRTKKEKIIEERIAAECRDSDGQLVPDAFERIQAITAQVQVEPDPDDDNDWDPTSDDTDSEDTSSEDPNSDEEEAVPAGIDPLEEAFDLDDPTRHPLYSPRRVTKTGRPVWFPSPTGCRHPSPPDDAPPS
jgi:hypothetical protein